MYPFARVKIKCLTTEGNPKELTRTHPHTYRQKHRHKHNNTYDENDEENIMENENTENIMNSYRMKCYKVALQRYVLEMPLRCLTEVVDGCRASDTGIMMIMRRNGLQGLKIPSFPNWNSLLPVRSLNSSSINFSGRFAMASDSLWNDCTPKCNNGIECNRRRHEDSGTLKVRHLHPPVAGTSLTICIKQMPNSNWIMH